MADIYNLADSNVASNAAIKASKLQGEYQFNHSQTGTVAAATEYGWISQYDGTIVSCEAMITETVATGADRTVTIDLHKSTGGGAFATVLSGTVVFNNGSTARTVSAATLSSTSLQDGDALKITVAVAGAAGNQALGLLVNVKVRQNPS